MTEGQTSMNWNAYCVNQKAAPRREKAASKPKQDKLHLRLSLKLSKATNKPTTRAKQVTKVTSKLRSHMARSLLKPRRVAKAKPEGKLPQWPTV